MPFGVAYSYMAYIKQLFDAGEVDIDYCYIPRISLN